MGVNGTGVDRVRKRFLEMILPVLTVRTWEKILMRAKLEFAQNSVAIRPDTKTLVTKVFPLILDYPQAKKVGIAIRVAIGKPILRLGNHL